jgi:hypothetical protein
MQETRSFILIYDEVIFGRAATSLAARRRSQARPTCCVPTPVCRAVLSGPTSSGQGVYPSFQAVAQFCDDKPPTPPDCLLPTAASNCCKISYQSGSQLERGLIRTDHGRAGVGCVVQHEDVTVLHSDLAVLEVLKEPGRDPIDELVEDRKAQWARL